MIKYQGLSTLEALEGAKRYNRWIAEQFLPYISYPLLEIGSGTGNLSTFFIGKGKTVLSDVDKELVKNLGKRFRSSKSASSVILDIADKIPASDKNKYKSIVAVNVLEHIKDDTKALKNMFLLLQKAGKLLLLVPAKQRAYTQLDKKLGHFRRYEKEDLIRKLKLAGFTVKKLYFFNMLGLLSWTIRDKVERGHQIRPYQAALFDLIVPLLKTIENQVTPPVGISLIVIAEKILR